MNLDRLAKMYYENAKRIVKEIKENIHHGKVTYNDYKLLRTASYLVSLGVEGIKQELIKLAKSCSGCVACKHSIPCPQNPCDLTCRYCELGLSQNKCNKFEPLIS